MKVKLVINLLYILYIIIYNIYKISASSKQNLKCQEL